MNIKVAVTSLSAINRLLTVTAPPYVAPKLFQGQNYGGPTVNMRVVLYFTVIGSCLLWEKTFLGAVAVFVVVVVAVVCHLKVKISCRN